MGIDDIDGGKGQGLAGGVVVDDDKGFGGEAALVFVQGALDLLDAAGIDQDGQVELFGQVVRDAVGAFEIIDVRRHGVLAIHVDGFAQITQQVFEGEGATE